MPLCISCPEMYKAPQQTSALWSHVDLLATLCDLVGIKTPPTAGISQMPVLTNPASQVRNSVLFAFDDSFLLDPAPAFNSHPGAADPAIYLRRLFLHREQQRSVRV